MPCNTLLVRKTVVGVTKEVTEGTYVAPTGSDVVQVNGFPGIGPSRELVDRDIIRDAIGKLKPKLGLRAGNVEVVVEFRGGGAAGGISERPEAFKLYESALGAEIDSTANGTVEGTTSTATVIQLNTGQGSNFQKGSIVLINGEVRFVLSVATDAITLNSALDNGAPTASDDVKGGFSYGPVTADHPPLSVTVFEDADPTGPEWQFRGCRVSSIAMTDFVTGQIPKATITLEVLDFKKIIGGVPTGIVFETTEPEVLINQFAERDGANQQINNFELTIANTVARQNDLTTAGGTQCMRVTERVVTGSFDPFVDSASIAEFTLFDDNTSFELIIAVGNKNTAGDFTQGSVSAVWLPQSILTEIADVDADGVVTQNLPFQAHINTTDDDIYFGFV